MSEFTVTYDSCIEAARLASSRGDRLGAEQALTAAIAAAGSAGSEALRAAALLKLGELKRDAGSLAEAEEMFARALDISEEVRGDDDASLVAALTNLAGIRAVRGAPEDSEKLLTRALAVSEKRLGREHPDLVVLLNDLSRLYLKRSAFALAEPLLHRLHAIKRQKGEDHAEVATVLASLATVRQALGDHDAAEQLWRRVLAIRERTLAPNHFAIATAVENLGETCSARGKVGEALRLFHRALAMREMTLGMAHPSLRTLREHIADLQLQGSEEFGGDDAVTFAAPPVPVRIPPAATYPTIEVPAMPPVSRAATEERVGALESRPVAADRPQAVQRPAVISTPEPGSETAAESAAAAEHEVRMQALRELAALNAAQAAAAKQATVEPPVATATPVAPAPVAYAQPKAPELEVPVWAEPEPVSPLAALARPPQPMSIVLPPPSGLDFDDDDSTQMEHYALAESRLQRMTASLAALFSKRQTQVVTAGAVGVALIVVAAALSSQPRGGSEDPALRRGAPTQEFVAGGAAALSDSGGGTLADSIASHAGTASTVRESSAPATDRPRTESPSSERTPAKAAPVQDAPAPVRVPDLPRSLASIPTAQLDEAMRSAAPKGVSIAPAVEKPGFDGGLGSVDYSNRSTVKQPPLLIGSMPRIPYPQNLRANGRETAGEVVVEFSVDTLGIPDMKTLRIIRSDHELLATAVFKVIPSMRFIPATLAGKKTASNVQMPFSFAIGKD